MGCDIHLKTFVFSKVENKFVPASGICEDCVYSKFPAIVGDRNYNLFGLFGNSVRSYYPELDCFEFDDCPEEIKNTAIYKYSKDIDFHTHRWCYANKLVKSLGEYVERLLDPQKWRDYYDDEDDFIQDVIDGKVSKKKYQELHLGVITSIYDLTEKIIDVKDHLSTYSEYIDIDKIIFLTWMDN